MAQGCGCQLNRESQAAPSKVTETLDFPGKREALGAGEGGSSGRVRKKGRGGRRGNERQKEETEEEEEGEEHSSLLVHR